MQADRSIIEEVTIRRSAFPTCQWDYDPKLDPIDEFQSAILVWRNALTACCNGNQSLLDLIGSVPPGGPLTSTLKTDFLKAIIISKSEGEVEDHHPVMAYLTYRVYDGVFSDILSLSASTLPEESRPASAGTKRLLNEWKGNYFRHASNTFCGYAYSIMDLRTLQLHCVGLLCSDDDVPIDRLHNPKAFKRLGTAMDDIPRTARRSIWSSYAAVIAACTDGLLPGDRLPVRIEHLDLCRAVGLTDLAESEAVTFDSVHWAVSCMEFSDLAIEYCRGQSGFCSAISKDRCDLGHGMDASIYLFEGIVDG